MFVSYENGEIRECCLLLGNKKIYSSFNIDEIKIIRSIIDDLKAAPRLNDLPVQYNFDEERNMIDIEYGDFKIICSVITSLKRPSLDKIERLKIIKIMNVGLEEDLARKNNFK